MFILPYRSVIKMTGADVLSFLQGVLTNDINLATDDKLLYALMLTPQGKVLYDFFILAIDGGYLLDVSNEYLEEIVKKFNMYRLRSDVSIEALNTTKIVVKKSTATGNLAKDPRVNDFDYYRGFVEDKELSANDEMLRQYHIDRIKLGIPEFAIDFLPQERFALELNMEKLNAINYKKGCYVGQEVTARSTHRGTLRKGLYILKLEDNPQIIQRGDEIAFQGQIIGNVMQPACTYCLAILSNEQAKEALANNCKLQLNGINATIKPR